MNRTRRIMLVVGLCLVSVWTVQGQGSLPKKALDKPRKYVNPIETVTYSPSNETFRGRTWQVYGDRYSAQTFTTPGGGNFRTTSFGETYVVVAEKGDFIRIAKDSLVSYRGKLSGSAIDYGWIHKRDILLWEEGLRSQKIGNLARKAMILNTVQSLRADAHQQRTDLEVNAVKCYQDPELVVPATHPLNLFQIFFIFKESDKAFLLGKGGFFGAANRDNIVGWVEKSRVIAWDQRVALEPNWSPTAAADRQRQQQKARIFRDEPSAQLYRDQGRNTDQTLAWDDDPFSQRRIGDYRRFPILQGEINDGIAHVGVMGEINTQNYQISSKKYAELMRSLTQGKAQRRNIDIVFVLDATSSMDSYFPPVQQAIQEVVGTITQRDGEQNSYRFGAVAYRDFLERRYQVEKTALSSDPNQVIGFLRQILEDYENRNINDGDLPEAMNLGLMTALREVGLNQKHTNIVVLVGDVGNHSRDDASQVAQSQITPHLTRLGCNVIAFQTANRAHNAYEEFVAQNKYLIRKAAENHFFAHRDDAAALNVNLQYPTWRPDPQMANTLRLENGAITGCIMSAESNQTLDPQKLKTGIFRLIQDLRGFNNTLLQAVENVGMAGAGMAEVIQETPASTSPYVSSFSAAMILFLKQQGFSIEELQAISDKSYQFFMPGFAVVKANGLEEPSFKSVLLVNRRELSELIRDMEQLNLVSTASALREEMINAWKELLRQHIGELSEREMGEMSLEEITQKVFGVPSRTPFMKVKLRDLADEGKVDDSELNRFLEGINRKIPELNRIFNRNDYAYSFLSNDVAYYWIEQDLLP